MLNKAPTLRNLALQLHTDGTTVQVLTVGATPLIGYTSGTVEEVGEDYLLLRTSEGDSPRIGWLVVPFTGIAQIRWWGNGSDQKPIALREVAYS